MIKSIKQSNVSITPIVTTKSWIVDNTNNSIDTSSTFPVIEGIKTTGIFYPSSSVYYDAAKNPLNWDGSYKSTVYNRDYFLYYKNKGSPENNFGVKQYELENRSIGDQITSVHIPKQYWGEKIIENSVFITDYSNSEIEINLIDDGNSNLKLVSSSIQNLLKITGSLGEIEKVFSGQGVTYTDTNGNVLTKEQSIELYKLGQDVFVSTSSNSYSYKNQQREYYDPLFDRFGSAIETDGNYLMVGSNMDSDSFSYNKNGIACLFKRDQVDYKQIKNFRSPFSQKAIALENSDYNLVKTEYGDFILYQTTGDFCISTSVAGPSPINDNFGKSIALSEKYCAISSIGGEQCKYDCETGSGLVFCYQNDKGGPDNWGMINVLQGSSSNDLFGYSLSTKNDVLAIGAPGYSGSGAVYIFRLKTYMSSGCDFIPTSSVYGSGSLADWSGSALLGIYSSSSYIGDLSGSGYWSGSKSSGSDGVITSVSSSLSYNYTVTLPENYLDDAIISVSASGFTSHPGFGFAAAWEIRSLATDALYSNSYVVNPLSTPISGSAEINVPRGYYIFFYCSANTGLSNGNYWFNPAPSYSTNPSIGQSRFDFPIVNSSSLFELTTTIYQRAFWKPLSQVCFTHITSNIFEPVIAETGSFFFPEFIVDDSVIPSNLFGEVTPVPIFVSGSKSWELETLLVGPYSGSGFGGCVSVGEDNRIIVGNNVISTSSLAWFYVASSSLSASCPIYNWQLKDTFQRSDADNLEVIPNGLNIKNNLSGFGNSVSIYGDYICIGTPYDRIFNGQYTLGSATIYKYSVEDDECGTGSLAVRAIQKIIPSDYEPVQYDFGHSCKLDRNKLIIGAPRSRLWTDFNVTILSSSKFLPEYYYESGSIKESSNILGKSFVYNLNLTDDVYELSAELSPVKEYRNTRKRFGESVSINSNTAFVGAPVFSYQDTGSIYWNSSSYENQGILSSTSSWEDDSGRYVFGLVYQYEINSNSDVHVGNVFYNNGTIIITNTASIYQNIFKNSGDSGYIVNYKGQHTLYETEYILDITPGEFNVSTNPTSLAGRTIPFDVNKDGVFDFNDLNLILKYINGDSPVSEFSEEDFLLEMENSKSWWKNDLLISEAEDAVIAKTLFASNSSDKSTLTLSRYNYIQSLEDSGQLDIDGNGEIDVRDGNLLWNFWLGRMSIEIVDDNISEDSTRKYLNDILYYLQLKTGKTSPYPTKKQAEILFSGSNVPYSENNGGFVNEYFKNYILSSSFDPTGSYLSTYITGIGLYSGGDLVLVGKLGTPIKNVIDYPMNFSIKFDAF